MKKNDVFNQPSHLLRISSLAAAGATVLISLSFANGAQLKEARVSQVIKDVKLLPTQAAPRPAVVRDEVREGTAVRTGLESRAELTFTDQTIARLGASTVFSFNQGTRNLDLGGGAMLLRVPKNAGGAQINTSAVTAAITGTTVMLEYHPDAFIKFIILEGTGRVFRKGHVGESVLLHAGQMLIVNPNGKGLPEPVDVDLDRLMKTSLLINGFDPLPSGDLIARAISTQDAIKGSGGLIETNLVIFGSGTTVALLDPTHTNALDQANSNEVRQATASPTPTPPPMTPTPTPMTPTPTPMTPTPTPDKFGTPPVIASTTPYEITNDTVINTDPTITTNGRSNLGTIYRGVEIDGPASQWLFGSTSDFDNMIGFDQNVFITDRLPLAAFKFSSLDLIGNPTVIIGEGGTNSLALVSVGDLTSGAPGGTLTFGGLNLLLATQDGSLTLTSDLTFQGIPNLGVYARGADSTLTFDAAVSGASIVVLYSEGNIAATNSLAIDETSETAGLNGLVLSLIAGQAITIGQDLTLSATNSGVITNALITVGSFAGDMTVNGVNGASLTIDNTGFQIEGIASLGVSAAGNFTSSSIDLFLDNNEGGSIGGEANVFFQAGGALTTGDFASFTINNGDTGGTIGSSASLDLSAAAISIGSSLSVNIANNSGGSIAGDATLSVTAGTLTTGADSGFSIDNSIFSNEGVFVGGEIAGNATISLLAANVTAGGGLFTFLYNDGGGHIAGDALVTAGLAGSLTTQGALFFDVQNSADTDSGTQTFPGGTIDGNASVTVAASGPITSLGLGEFAVLNNDFRFLDTGGTIAGNATVILSATGVTTGTYFQPLVNNTNGIISGDASVSVAISGDVSVGAETFFNILNSNGRIGGLALSSLVANNFTSGSTFEFKIANDGGSIGSGAVLEAALNGSLTSTGDAFIQIINSGGSIGGDALITLGGVNLTADSSLFVQIDNTGGTISGSATIDSDFIGTATISGDANVNIFGGDPIGGAAIDFVSGTYNVGGTFRNTIDGNGAITFSDASVNADVLKSGVFGANGTLTVGGGTLSGNTELKLYAPGSNGSVNFISNVTLNSNSSVIIAANAVTINNGVVVTITGDDGVDASVFTNVPNYTGSGGNGNTSGTFAGNGAQTLPLDQAPPFDSDAAKGQAKVSTTSGGGTAAILPHTRRPVATTRVADSNALLDLAAQTVGPTETSLNRSSAPAGRNARASAVKGSLPASKIIPASLTINRRESRTPLALP